MPTMLTLPSPTDRRRDVGLADVHAAKGQHDDEDQRSPREGVQHTEQGHAQQVQPA